jgi:hypothetical protein
MENKKLINEITRIQEMMGVNIITESGLSKFVDKQVARFFDELLPGVEKLAKTGTKELDNEIMQDVATKFNQELESKSGMPYSKKLKSLNINNLDDLVKSAEKFSEKQFKEISSYILTKSLKEIESTGKLSSLIDDNILKGDTLKPIRDILEVPVPDKIEDIEGVKTYLDDLKKVRNDIEVNGYNLSNEGKQKLISDYDAKISEVEGKIQKTIEPDLGKGAADAGTDMINNTAEEATEETDIIKGMSDILDNLDKGNDGKYVIDKKRITALLESKGVTGSKAKKIISIIERASVKSDAEMLKVFEDSVTTILKKEGASPEIISKFLTKFDAAKEAFGRLGFAGKVTFWIATDLIVANTVQGLMYMTALDQTFPTVYGIFQILGFHLAPGINTIRQSFVDSAEEIKKGPEQNNSSTSAPNNSASTEATKDDFKTWYDKKYPQYSSMLTSWEVDGSDKSIIIAKGKKNDGTEVTQKYKKLTDGTYEFQK